MNNQKLNFERFCQMCPELLAQASVTFWKEHVLQCHIEDNLIKIVNNR